MINVNGVLRNVLTQAAPKPRSTGTGETRIAASRTPSTRAKNAEAAVSRRIQRNPVTYTSMLAGSVKTLIVLLTSKPGGAGGTPAPPVTRGQPQFVSLPVSSVGAARPLSPSVLSHAALYDPSAAAAFRMSLTLVQPAVSVFFRPMPYGSSLNFLPTTLNLPAYCGCAAYPARMMSSVVTAST